MKSSQIIHIGYPRTATTWLQNEFYPKVKNYKYYSIKEFKKNHITDNIKILNKIKIDDNKNFIFSWEKYTGDDNKNIEEYAKQIYNFFPSASIILFLRNQIDIYISRYSSYIKHGGTYSFEKYFFRQKKEHHLAETFNYFEIIDIYKKLFGDKNIEVFLYEDFKENNELFIKKYNTIFDFNIDCDNINYSEKNTSIYQKSFKIFRVLNLFYSGNIKYKVSILPSLVLQNRIKKIIYKINNYNKSNLKKPKKYINQNHIEFLRKYYKFSNNNLLKQYPNLNLQKYNYPI